MERSGESLKRERLEELASAVLGSLDSEESGEGLARRACYSRPHFHRLFRALLEENPGEMRRRLLLERAAYQLSRTGTSVTEIAFDAQFGSLEGFIRAFRKAFGLSPSHYRRLGPAHYRLQAKNGIHFYAPGSRQKGDVEVDLFDRFAGADSWHTRRILERARSLTDEQMDRPLENKPHLFPFCSPDQSLRDLLDRIVSTKEVWTAAFSGREMPPSETDRSVEGMLTRWNEADGEFNRILREVRDESRWDDTFVDALCEPPETFTFGGMFGHVVTFNTYRRLMALEVMRRYGIDDLGFGDVVEWENALALTPSASGCSAAAFPQAGRGAITDSIGR
jgi:AraC family transcriptional regulator